MESRKVNSTCDAVSKDIIDSLLERWVVKWLKKLLFGLLRLGSNVINTSFEELEFLEALERSLVELFTNTINLVVLE